MQELNRPKQCRSTTLYIGISWYLSISDCFQDFTTLPSSLPPCEESLCGCHRFVSHVYRLKECIETCTLHPSHPPVTWKLYEVNMKLCTVTFALRPLHQNCILWPVKWPASVTPRIPRKTGDLACKIIKINATVASPPQQ